MSDYFIYYTESNLICLIIFGIMLGHDLLNVDRQEKMIKYDNALVAFMLYFVSDIFWGAIIAGVIPKNIYTAAAANFSNYLLMNAITYTWLEYVMVFDPLEYRTRRLDRIFWIAPFLISTVLLILVFIFRHDLLFDAELNVRPVYNLFLIAVPIMNIISCMLFSVRRALKEENIEDKHRHLVIGFFPLTVIAAGLLQVVVLPNTPVFCFGCTIFMLIFYIHSMETQISMDPLTRLNNRGQLLRYVSQGSALHIEGTHTYVVMIDVNNFKQINDTYGHIEGDRALLILSDALRNAVRSRKMQVFLSRYGGDEFLLIAHPEDEEQLLELIAAIRKEITAKCAEENTPYMLTVGIGYDELKPEGDTFQQCQKRADEKMYSNKKLVKAGQ